MCFQMSIFSLNLKSVVCIPPESDIRCLYVESCYLDYVSVYIYSVVLWGRGPVVEVDHLDCVNIDPLQSLSIGPSSIAYVKTFRWNM
jgi:hypothetical protein